MTLGCVKLTAKANYDIAHQHMRTYLLLSSNNFVPHYSPSIEQPQLFPNFYDINFFRFHIWMRFCDYSISVPTLSQCSAKVYLSIQTAVITGLHSFYVITVLLLEDILHFSYRLTIDEHWSSFHFLTFVNTAVKWGHMGVTLGFCFPLNICPIILRLHYIKFLFTVFWELLILFSTVAILIYVATNNAPDPFSSTTLLRLIICLFW